MGADYGFDRLFVALSMAAGSALPLQERVTAVVRRICDLKRSSFPDDETWNLFQSLLAEAAKHMTHGDERIIPATTAELSDDEAIKWFQRAVGLFGELAEAHGRQNP